jgi:orotate phosphoribosyltransferase
VVIVEDVITTGGQVALSAADLREAGAELVAVVCAIYRGDGEPHVKGLEGVPVLAALTRDQLA